jgi:hypothetical protein
VIILKGLEDRKKLIESGRIVGLVLETITIDWFCFNPFSLDALHLQKSFSLVTRYVCI